MRVALVYNQDASNAMPAADVRRAIEGEGHRVVVQLAATEDVRRALTGDLDLVAVAGGDGTMRGVALQTSGYGIPLAVIPLGTANNIAASLGWPDGEVRETVRAWRAARRTPFDLGVARGSSAIERR